MSQSSLIVGLSIILAIGSSLLYAFERPEVRQVHFNFYAILSFLPLTVNVWIGIAIMRLRTQSEEAVWFVLYLCALSIACFGEGMQRLSVHPAGAVYWYALNGIGYALLPIAYYLFASSYIKPLRLQSALLLPSLVTSAGMMVFFFSGTNLFFSLDPNTWIKEPWGFNAPTNAAFPILLVWIEVPLYVALFTLVHFARHVSNDLLRRQARIYIWAILIPLVGGTITDGILPFLHINSIVPTSLFLSTCTSIVAYIGLKRYRSFQVDPTVYSQGVIQTMHEAVIITDTNHKINYVNPEAERLLGSSYAELSGAKISEKFSSDAWHTLNVDLLKGTGRRSSALDPDKLSIIHSSGATIPVSVYTSRLDADTPNEAHIFIIADISDITASYHQLQDNAARISSQNHQLQENQLTMQRLLKEAEILQDQLKHEKENVEHTVEVRTAELREARDKLKASDQLKSEFIMLSSHNLRTPLTIMRSSVELLASDNNNLNGQQKLMVDSLTDSTSRLGEFIEDLLTIATLEAGDELSLTPTPLQEIVAPLIDEVTNLAKSKGIHFAPPMYDKDIMVNANALRMRGAIRNLLHNAINFTKEGEVSFIVEANTERVRLIIRDTGIGIAPEEIPKLFTKFHRGTSTLTYDYPGGGIGLYLTKLVVDEHRGQITAESVYGKGSTFTVELPLVPQPAPARLTEARPADVPAAQ